MDLSSWLWIALFISFALGWLFARYDIKSILKNNNKLPIEYFKGLQYILNEQPDKAIDAFIQVAQLDPETADLHLALGQMFRKKGEFNRSIRIHESLSNRGLSKEYQEKSYIALGEDYYRAGMFDRADKIFSQFTGHPIYNGIAVKYLLIIAKLEQDWKKAVKLADFLPEEQKEHQKIHLHLQYIDSLINLKSFDEIEKEFSSINSKYHHHPRFMLVKANFYLHIKKTEQAVDILKQVIINNKNINYEVIFPLIKKAYADNLELILDFFNLLEKNGIELDNTVYQFKYQTLIFILKEKIQTQQDTKDIISKLDTLLEKEFNKPSLDTIKRYTEFLLEFKNYNLEENKNMLNKVFLSSISQLLKSDSNIKYICSECGFRAKNFSWSCHGCGEWESLNTI